MLLIPEKHYTWCFPFSGILPFFLDFNFLQICSSELWPPKSEGEACEMHHCLINIKKKDFIFFFHKRISAGPTQILSYHLANLKARNYNVEKTKKKKTHFGKNISEYPLFILSHGHKVLNAFFSVDRCLSSYIWTVSLRWPLNFNCQCFPGICTVMGFSTICKYKRSKHFPFFLDFFFFVLVIFHEEEKLQKVQT